MTHGMSDERSRMADLPSSDERRRREAALKELSAEWDRVLAPLQEPGARARVEAALAAKGRAKTRSKAGPSF